MEKLELRFENYSCDHILKIWLFCKPELNYFVGIKVFRISLCWQFTCLHNLTWTFLRHIYWTILVYKTLKICNLFDTSYAITLAFIQESMNRVHDLIVKLCEIVNWFSKSVFTLLILLFYQTNQQARFLKIMILCWLT